MEDVECIDPRLGKEVSRLMEMSTEECIQYFSAEPSSLKEPRLHWYSCPSCRTAYPGAEETMKSVRHGIVQWAKATLSKTCERHLVEEDSLSSPEGEQREFYADKLASLVVYGDELHEHEVQWALGYAVEGIPDFTVRCDVPEFTSQRVPLTRCAEFILPLEPRAQRFVFASVLSHETYYQLFRAAFHKTQEKLLLCDPETEELVSVENDEYEHPYDVDFIRSSIKRGIATISVPPEIAYETIQAAASDYVQRFKKAIGESTTTEQSSNVFTDDFKSEIVDSFDSLKAGQNEVIRLIERNIRPASAFEPDIEMQLGVLYGRLEEKTQHLLQIAEYLYDINKSEPNYFHGPVLMMADAYENELNVRLIGRYIMLLLKKGTKTYYCNDFTTKPLIEWGSPRNLNLGNMLWYLKNDNRLHDWAEKIGFCVSAISNDAGWLTRIRNRAAHPNQKLLERSVADEVRHRMLRSDGMLARLFAADSEVKI